MFGLDEWAAELASLVAREEYDSSGFFRITFKHATSAPAVYERFYYLRYSPPASGCSGPGNPSAKIPRSIRRIRSHRRANDKLWVTRTDVSLCDRCREVRRS